MALERPEVIFWLGLPVTVTSGTSIHPHEPLFSSGKLRLHGAFMEMSKGVYRVYKTGAHSRRSDATSLPGNPDLFPDLEFLGPASHVAIGCCQLSAVNDTRWPWSQAEHPQCLPASPLNLGEWRVELGAWSLEQVGHTWISMAARAAP